MIRVSKSASRFGKRSGVLAFAFVIIIILAMVIPGCAGQAPAATTPAATTPAATTPAQTSSGKTVKLTFAWNDVWGDLSTTAKVFRPGGIYQRLLYQRSNGRLQITPIPRMFPGGDGIFNAIVSKQADLGDVTTAWMTGTYPVWDWQSVPGITSIQIEDAEREQLAIYQDPAFRKAWGDILRKQGAVYLATLSWAGPSGSFSNKKATTLDELRTLKTRIYGYLNSIGFKALGIPTISIPGPEVPQALMSGTIDANYTIIAFGYSQRYQDLVKYIIPMPFSALYGEYVMINAEVYDNLPADLRDILTQVSFEIEEMMSQGNFGESAIALDAMKSVGMEVVQLDQSEYDKIAELLKPMETEYVRLAGPEGAELLRLARDAVARYRAIPKQF